MTGRVCGQTLVETELNTTTTTTTTTTVTTTNLECHGDIVSGERRTKLFCNLHPKPKTVFELKVAQEKT